MIGELIVIAHIGIMSVGWYFGFLEGRAPAVPGDSPTLFGGVSFLYWATVMIVSGKARTDDWLLRFLNRRGNAVNIGIIFGFFGVAFVPMGLA